MGELEALFSPNLEFFYKLTSAVASKPSTEYLKILSIIVKKCLQNVKRKIYDISQGLFATFGRVIYLPLFKILNQQLTLAHCQSYLQIPGTFYRIS